MSEGLYLRKECSSLGLYLLLVHFGLLLTMCRVRFGLTGIYFDSLEPSRPREEFFQPLIAAIPPVAQNKQRDVVPEAIDGGVIKEKVVLETRLSKNDEDGIAKNPSDSSSSSRDEEGCRLAKNAKTNLAFVENKRVQDSSSSSSSSLPSSASLLPLSSPPSTSDEDQIHKRANSKASVQAPKPPKPTNSRTTQRCNDKSSKRHTSIPLGRLTKAPPAKRVRFAMDVQERIIPSEDVNDTSSSHSSDDSYTDPPSSTEPYDAFAGYYRTSGASRSHRMNGRIAGSKTRFPAEEEIKIDGVDGFLDSEDGSEIDVQGLPVRGRPPRTVRAAGKGHPPDQRHHRNSSTPLARSRHSSRVMDHSRVTAGGLESNVNGRLHLEQSHASQKQPVSPLRSGQSRYPKLRSGKNLPEPIFVVRPRFLSDAKEKGKPAELLSGSGYSRPISMNGHEGTKTSPPRPTRVKAPKKIKAPKYRPPSVSDDLKKDVEFDETSGLLIRDV